MKVCLSNIWTRIVRNRGENDKFHTGKSIWVYLDKFHHFFKTKAPPTQSWHTSRVRKYGGIMTGITQDVQTCFVHHKNSNVQQHRFLHLPEPVTDRQNQLQQLYGISDNLIEYIKDKPAGTGLITTTRYSSQ